MLFTAVFLSTGCVPKEFTVTFNGGTDDAVLAWGKEKQVVTSSSQIKVPIYTRPGYNFVGWDRSISMIEESTTVKAQWRAYEFQVVFQGNGGKTESDEEVVTVKVDSAFELEQIQPEFVKEGFELSWDIALYTITNSCTVNAVWTAKKYDLTFLDKDGLEFENNKIELNFNQKLGDFNVVAPKVSGKRFAYWSEDASNGGMSIDKGIVWAEDKNATFYPNYVDENDFIITYDLNGGQRGQRTYSYNVDTNENANILFDAKRKGYSFVGWLIGDSTTPKLSKDITIKDFKINGKYSDVTLKAVWENRPYVIDYDLQGGTLNGESMKEVVFNQTIGELPIAEKEGYVFVGWYYEGKMITKDDLWEYPTDATLSAKYLAKYNVKFSLTTVVKTNDAIVECEVNDGSFSQITDIEQVELTLTEGQSLYTAFNFTKMPIVVPIEQTGQNEYEFGGYWKWIDHEGNEHVVDVTTVFTLKTFANVNGGETITLVPHIRQIWSPNA